MKLLIGGIQGIVIGHKQAHIDPMALKIFSQRAGDVGQSAGFCEGYDFRSDETNLQFFHGTAFR